GAKTPRRRHPKDCYEKSQRPATQLHGHVIHDDVPEGRRKESQRQRYEPVDQQQNTRNQLYATHQIDKVRANEPTNAPAIPASSGTGIKFRKPLRPKTKNISPRRIRVMAAAIS